MTSYACRTWRISAAGPAVVPSACSNTDDFGTGHVLSPVVTSRTSWPAVTSPRARTSSTSSDPPYAGGGTGNQGGETMAMRTRVSLDRRPRRG